MLTNDPHAPEALTPPGAPTGNGADGHHGPPKREPSGWHRIGKLAAEQAVPIAVGMVSLIIAVDAWISARPMTWEKERALASVEISSNVVKTKGVNGEAVVTMKVSNVGELSFAILDLHLKMETTGSLAGVWNENSLLDHRGAALPIGLRPFTLDSGSDSAHAQIQFDEREKTWHVVDPGRSVEITYVQPVRGSGHLAVLVDLYTQPMKMEDVASAIKVDEVVDGVKRPTMPEWGTGEVSDMPVYPYTAGHVLIVPPQ